MQVSGGRQIGQHTCRERCGWPAVCAAHVNRWLVQEHALCKWPAKGSTTHQVHQICLAATSPAPVSRPSSPLASFSDACWKEAFTAAVQDSQDLLMELGFKGKISNSLPWRVATIRHVQLKAGLVLQFSYFGEKQNVVKNAAPGSADAKARLQELLNLPFSSASLKTSEMDVSVQLTKSGKAIIHRSNAAAAPKGTISLTHNRVKDLPIAPDTPHPFLQRIGMQTADGRLKAGMVDKMAQVNEFLKLLRHTGVIEGLQHDQAADGGHAGERGRVRILDCGCGSAYLTFGVWHYLNNVLGVPAQLLGVDNNAMLMNKSNAYCRELGLSSDEATFITSAITDYAPAQPPDVVLALHACDIATDQALALGVKQGAALIMAVPCCHQHLHKQLSGAKALTVSPLQPLMRQGITKQRTLDLVTDTLRAQILRILGYKTDVAEFVSTEHTPRNILIRAVRAKAGAPDAADVAGVTAQLVQEYLALKAFWGGVTPHLETLLEQELQPLLSAQQRT